VASGIAQGTEGHGIRDIASAHKSAMAHDWRWDHPARIFHHTPTSAFLMNTVAASDQRQPGWSAIGGPFRLG